MTIVFIAAKSRQSCKSARNDLCSRFVEHQRFADMSVVFKSSDVDGEPTRRKFPLEDTCS
jgi:hypothetical protein